MEANGRPLCRPTWSVSKYPPVATVMTAVGSVDPLCLAALETELRIEGRHRRELRGGRDRGHPWERRETLDQAFEEHIHRWARIALPRQRQPHRQHAPRIESRIDALDVQEAADEQTGAKEQEHGQRDLRHDQALTETLTAWPGTRASIRLERIVRIGAHRVQCGDHADQDAGNNRQAQTPPEHSHVQARVEIEEPELLRDDDA